MAWTYDQTIAGSWEENEAERAEALADLERARVSEDWSGFRAARARLREAEQEAAWISQKANTLYEQQQRAERQPSNKFGLSEEQRELAHAALIDRPDMPRLTDEQKEEIYARNLGKYRHMVASGQYGGSPAGRSK
jgi:hypothetical protein